MLGWVELDKNELSGGGLNWVGLSWLVGLDWVGFD